MDFKRNMANAIRILKEECGKTLSEFADYLDVSRSALQEYKSGKNSASAAAVELLAGKLGMDVPFLTSGAFSPDQIEILLRLLKLLKLLATLSPEHRVRFAMLLLEMVLLWNGAVRMPETASVISLTEALTFRSPMRVSAVRAYRTSCGLTSFPVCPHCRITMECEYQSFCDRCGQALDWKHFSKAMMILPEK